MDFEFSRVGEKLATGSGIGELMDDLGAALAGGDDVKMLGGGQPAMIPEMSALWRERLGELLDSEEGVTAMLERYDPPAGSVEFRQSVASMLRGEYGWDVDETNVAVTAGGQTAFFYLFNLLAGQMPGGQFRRVLLPLVPEYIGYSDQGIDDGLFVACRPQIEEVGEDQFKYRIDFDALSEVEDVGAVCVSRPTNPSGNVLTDEEIDRLHCFARERGVPLIIDNAYGAPFPGILFRDVSPVWDEGMILTMSLSKVGLPGTRTGIVVASSEIVSALSSMTAITGLANNNVGQRICSGAIRDGTLTRMAREVVRPYYRARSERAQALIREEFGDAFPWKMHVSEGALFLWLWFPDLPISSKMLYQRLKARGVLVIPGEYFFYGVEDRDWSHCHECVRVSYAMSESVVCDGIRIMGEELKRIVFS